MEPFLERRPHPAESRRQELCLGRGGGPWGAIGHSVAVSVKLELNRYSVTCIIFSKRGAGSLSDRQHSTEGI